MSPDIDIKYYFEIDDSDVHLSGKDICVHWKHNGQLAFQHSLEIAPVAVKVQNGCFCLGNLKKILPCTRIRVDTSRVGRLVRLYRQAETYYLSIRNIRYLFNYQRKLNLLDQAIEISIEKTGVYILRY